MKYLIERLRAAATKPNGWAILGALVATEAADALERLTAENAALRKDAERYRWLRIPENGVSVTIADEDDPETWYEYDSLRLDAAIDAAMEQSHDK